ncbi:LLM class flavin-dependent oxidoreductase [Virgibacillus litoralis]|uniref:Luciferase family oxidoreductase group 1 n=1 Tax=Virgibacillus litoralis TaxID=578221 RepID=A0ABS4HAG6_9BACI|nr:LLM class flavin-dependent oxidoreductase [Virgibacillus litoralis]MBP1947863.1 luciferase family oxidoreductase group 1 [Virgibacillus litoralis]
MRLSILDQAPISNGKTANEALAASIKLAQTGDDLGYTRYWIAEHHDLPGLACPAPDLMLGMIGAQTSRIRIGAGAVLLPHYKPFNVAERYNMLATLFPNRIDLGIGRAPGGSAEASIALSGDFLKQVNQFSDSIDEVLGFLHNSFPKDHMYSKIKPSPVPTYSPEPWLLGTSEKSAILAAEKGLPYVYGHFMSDADGPSIVKQYTNKHSETIVTVSVICAETTDKANELALSSQLWSVQRAKGESSGRIPSVEEAKTYSFSDKEKETIRKLERKMIIGNPKEVKEQLEQLQLLYQVDEFMLVTITHSYEARQKSYELIAKEMLADN